MPPKVHNLIFEKWYRFCAFSFLIYGERVSGDLPGRIPAERVNATDPANELSVSKGVLEGKSVRSVQTGFPKSVSIQPDGMLSVDSPLPLSSSRPKLGWPHPMFIHR